MDKPQIIGLGLNGLIGSRIIKLLEKEYEFINLNREQGVDITNPKTLLKINEYVRADYVLHLAAKTDVDGCEAEKELKEKSEAWRVNVEGTKNVAKICLEFDKKIIYFSTDFVFDGEKEEKDRYSEEDKPNPVNWYATTKYAGEQEVIKSGADYLILRTAYPYRAQFGDKKDFYRAIKEKFENKEKIDAVTDQYFCPTYIDDISNALNILINTNAHGIYHVVGSMAISPFEASVGIADVFNFDKNLINKTTREDFFRGKAQRPFNLNLRNDKIVKLGAHMNNFEDGLLIIKSQK